MPIRRLFSEAFEEDIAHILPTFGSDLSPPSTEDRSDTSWSKLDDEDSGLGFDEPIEDDTATNSKRQRVSPDHVLDDNSILIADGSRPHSLPTVSGKHNDIKSISPQTLADVISGCYDDVIHSYRIIDCRYPYEFDGGHIKGAENRYLHTMIQEILQQPKNQVLIFHCEFSQERGPGMLRFLRSKDRELNSDNYPALNFPEIYLVDGGYMSFFEQCPDLCNPRDYRPMLHCDFTSQLHHFRRAADIRHFRRKSKSWSAGDKGRLAKKVIF